MCGPMTLGIDPDTHATGFAVTDGAYVYGVGVYKVPVAVKAQDAVPRMAALLRRIQEDCEAVGGYERAVIEGQQVYLGTSNANPEAILRVAQIAGAALAGCLRHWTKEAVQPTDLLFPRPREWKGSVPKDIHQARVLNHFGWPYEKAGSGASAYCRPLNGHAPPEVVRLTPVNKSDWKHIVDAMGLSKWGAVR